MRLIFPVENFDKIGGAIFTVNHTQGFSTLLGKIVTAKGLASLLNLKSLDIIQEFGINEVGPPTMVTFESGIRIEGTFVRPYTLH